jgi:ComF family protein
MVTIHRSILNGLQNIADLFYPQLCAGCSASLESSVSVLCFRCLQELPLTNFHLLSPNPVEKIFWGRIDVAAATSLFYFTQDTIVQRMMHQLKYRGNKEVGIAMGRKLGETMLHNPRFRDVDYLLPLPLHPKKLKLRGYNQAEVIANGVSEITGWQVLPDLIKRKRFTDTQTHKSRQDRWENMKDRFFNSDSEFLYGKHVVLIDDVITTGATLEACGIEILNGGKTRLSLATIAYVLK